jgi:hypothetical protein
LRAENAWLRKSSEPHQGAQATHHSPTAKAFHDAIDAKAQGWRDIFKIGRTQMHYARKSLAVL